MANTLFASIRVRRKRATTNSFRICWGSRADWLLAHHWLSKGLSLGGLTWLKCHYTVYSLWSKIWLWSFWLSSGCFTILLSVSNPATTDFKTLVNLAFLTACQIVTRYGEVWSISWPGGFLKHRHWPLNLFRYNNSFTNPFFRADSSQSFFFVCLVFFFKFSNWIWPCSDWATALTQQRRQSWRCQQCSCSVWRHVTATDSNTCCHIWPVA